MTATAHTDETDTLALRRSLGAFPTGVTVVTTIVDGIDLGLTVSSFTSVSLDPPLVLWSLRKRSALLDSFDRCDNYAIHVLASNQKDVSHRFTSHGDRFSGLVLTRGAGGVPLLHGCCATFECFNERRHDGGDHIIFLGRVLRHSSVEADPLIFHGGNYSVINRIRVPA